jgi:HJR/Mrr/RecB family endonuclease
MSISKPLPEFAAYRASRNVGDYSHWVGPTDVLDAWLLEQDERHDYTIPAPPGVRNAYDVFLTQEGRGLRRLIDVPDPAYKEGNEELNALVDRVLLSRDAPSLVALIASIQVDLDWIRLRNQFDANSQGWRIEHRLRRAIERVIAVREGGVDASTLLYHPTLTDIAVAVQAVSDDLVAHLVRHPQALHELRPRQFEELIAHVLEKFGWDIELTPETRDGGYDILAVSKNVHGSGLRMSYIVECKKYRADRKVGIAVARQLLQVKGERGASHAVIATTSDFTSGVYAFAANRLDLDTKNADAVIEWCRNALTGSGPIVS